MAGRWVKDNSVVLSDSLVLFVLDEVYALHELYVWVTLLFYSITALQCPALKVYSVGLQDQLQGTLTLPPGLRKGQSY